MNEMENLRRVFNVTKGSNQPSLGQTVFYDSPMTNDGQSAQYYTSNFVNSEKKEGSVNNIEKVRQVCSVCSAYTEELLYLCHTGLCMAKLLEENLSLMTCDSTVGTKSAQEMAGHFVTLWNNLSISTKKLVTNFEDEVLVTLRENIVNNHNEKSFSETNNLFVTCFLAIIQVHYQFSVSMFDTLVQLLSSVPSETKLPSSVSSPLEFALKDPLDLMASWTDSLSEMQKHLLNIRLHFSHNFGTGIKNDLYHCSSINQPSKRRWSFGGLRQSSSNDWLPKQWPAVGKRMEMDSSHVQGLWPIDKESLMPLASDDSRPPSFDLSANTKRGSTDSQKSSTFASNEELQDVISLLSCQPSNPSSPSPDPSNQLASNNGQNLLWSAAPHSSSGGFGADHVENNEQAVQNQYDEFVTWNNADAAQPYGDLRLQSLLQRAPSDLSPVTTSSWSTGTNLQQLHCVTKSSAESSPTLFANLESNAKESEFFMGLEFVGSDLMASVRQRRHSSGESLCKSNWMPNSSSFRTKSIDGMIAEGKCPKTSTWPLKQLSPNSSLCYGFEDPGILSKSVNWATSADCPQGLPPSGFDCKNRNKMAKKYCLFGNPT